jgi:hypothetical protein
MSLKPGAGGLADLMEAERAAVRAEREKPEPKATETLSRDSSASPGDHGKRFVISE